MMHSQHRDTRRRRVGIWKALAMLLVAVCGVCCVLASVVNGMQAIPSVAYSDLFLAVQTAPLFDDQKTFCDAVPLSTPETIMREWHANHDNLTLAAFVDRWFVLETEPPVEPPANLSLRDHIVWLWPHLTRNTPTSNSSLVPLPNPYVVPGSRFRESYYWY